MRLDTTLAEATPPTRRRWQAWARREPVLRDVTYQDLRAELADRATPRLRADALLAALARLARLDGDAGRVLLGCLVPGLRALAGRYRRSLGYDEAFAVAVGALWDRVARFDPPTCHVAYRLLWIAGRRVHDTAIAQRQHAAPLEPLTSCHTPSTPEPGLPVGVLLTDAVNAGVVNAESAWLVWSTHVEGLELAGAASLLGIGYDTAKKRRQRAGAALRDWLGADCEASL